MAVCAGEQGLQIIKEVRAHFCCGLLHSHGLSDDATATSRRDNSKRFVRCQLRVQGELEVSILFPHTHSPVEVAGGGWTVLVHLDVAHLSTKLGVLMMLRKTLPGHQSRCGALLSFILGQTSTMVVHQSQSLLYVPCATQFSHPREDLWLRL